MSFSSINLGLREVFQDPVRRHEFFKSITQDEIAAQIRKLRKDRELTQQAFADRADMKQSAVSRIERADYSSWTLTTLFRVAFALNARWRIILEPVEDAVAELERMEEEAANPVRGEAAANFVKAQASVKQTVSSLGRTTAPKSRLIDMAAL